jgi:Protein of unknown function (DUF3300)
MITKDFRAVLSLALSFVLVTFSSLTLYGQPPAPSTGPGGPNPTESAAMDANQLQGLVAPIALYPDQLVAAILGAATFPDQVAVASYWLEQNKKLTGKDLTKEVDKQTWDGSVKALTAFPTVLDNLAKNLAWTSSLGEAYHNQQADVMKAVQTLRAQAKEKGNLKTTSEITVAQPAPQTIVIQPANPQIVYVPMYNPAVIYGYPYVTPGYSAGAVAAATAISFGAGIAVGALMTGAWGWNSWGCDWHGGVVVYNHNSFYGNTAWHGGYYNGGYHNSYGYNNAYNRANVGNVNRANVGNTYRGGDNTINRNVTGNTVNVDRQGAQNLSADRPAASSAWHDSGFGGGTGAFSGLSNHSGGFGGSGGWDSRAASNRGWGSMSAGGFSGGRFGGGGFGGGGFRGRR